VSRQPILSTSWFGHRDDDVEMERCLDLAGPSLFGS
jgi:hypothetical protein